MSQTHIRETLYSGCKIKEPLKSTKLHYKKIVDKLIFFKIHLV